MPTPNPSIQSFFSSSPLKYTARTSPSSPSLPPPSPLVSSPMRPIVGDGFTREELETVIYPPSAQWAPTQHYEEANIGDLRHCSHPITFTGRVVNLYRRKDVSKSERAAKGMLKLMVADDTGAVTVRLYYADVVYETHLGQLVTVWTRHISPGEQSSLAPASAPLFTSIFPERERSCHISFVKDGDDGTLCKRPYGCIDEEVLPGLITIKNYIDGGYGVEDCKLLVCVKSIGPRKRVTTKKGFTFEVVDVGVFDDIGQACLSLTDAACVSASHWQPSHTVLLISKPLEWSLDKIPKLRMSSNTRVDVDPEMADAVWLRSLAQRLTRRDHVNPPFPEGVFDVEAAETAPLRMLFTLAEIDELARSSPRERFTGYISVIVTDMNLVSNYRGKMLMCTECCGIPLYANAPSAKCKQCEKIVPLRINPRILGPLIDETGHLASGKLIFSEAAWSQLLGRSPAQLVREPQDVLAFMEHRMRFLRVSLGFGWCVEGTAAGDDDKGVDLERWGRKRKRIDVFSRAKEDGEGKRVKMGDTSEGWNRDDIVSSGGDSKDGGKEAMGKGAVSNGSSKSSGIGSSNGNNGNTTSSSSSGIGEVGRLCIWCVKM